MLHWLLMLVFGRALYWLMRLILGKALEIGVLYWLLRLVLGRKALRIGVVMR